MNSNDVSVESKGILLRALAVAILRYGRLPDIINSMWLRENGNCDWGSIFEAMDSPAECLKVLYRDLKQTISNDELTLLVRPLLAEEIASAIGAKEVTIIW